MSGTGRAMPSTDIACHRVGDREEEDELERVLAASKNVPYGGTGHGVAEPSSLPSPAPTHGTSPV
eukprot:471223-Rhodomonas_salina.1